MEKHEFEDGTLPIHVETYVRQKLTPREVLQIIDREKLDEIEPGQNLQARPFTTSSD